MKTTKKQEQALCDLVDLWLDDARVADALDAWVEVAALVGKRKEAEAAREVRR